MYVYVITIILGRRRTQARAAQLIELTESTWHWPHQTRAISSQEPLVSSMFLLAHSQKSFLDVIVKPNIAEGINLGLTPSNTRHIAPGATRAEHVSPRTFPELILGRCRLARSSLRRHAAHGGRGERITPPTEPREIESSGSGVGEGGSSNGGAKANDMAGGSLARRLGFSGFTMIKKMLERIMLKKEAPGHHVVILKCIRVSGSSSQ